MIFALIIQFLIFLTLSIRCIAQDTCIEKFDLISQEAAVGDPNELSNMLVFATADVSETTEEGKILYYISWQDDLAAGPFVKQANDSTLDYLSFNIAEKNLSVGVNSSMAGLIDYGTEERQTILILYFYFEFIYPNKTVAKCIFEINHVLIDENTQAPYLENSMYEISLREDFPPNMVISEFQTVAYDFDAMNPNNMFTINVNPECPLLPSDSTYTCEEGKPVNVEFILSTTLDYDQMEDPYEYLCSVNLIDKGTPTRNSTSSVTVTVTPYSDEPPCFADGNEYYKGKATESVVGTTVETEPTIAAYDQDVPPTDVSFNMTSADSSVDGDKYFAMNETTGVITVIQDIDNEFLSLRSVDFLITACDADSQCSRAFLSMDLPTVSQNTSFLQFERLTYSAQIFTPASGDQILRVHAQTSENEDDVEYSFVEEGSTGLEYFSIDGVSGWITATANDTPSYMYTLNTMATVGELVDQTKVNIDVLLPSEGFIMMRESVVMLEIEENNATLLFTVEAEGATFYCIVACWPETLISSFELNNNTGELSIIDGLDADNSEIGNEVTLIVAAYDEPSDCQLSNISNRLMSYEELIAIAIIDVDEYSPSFVDPGGRETDTILYAYPEEKALQKTIGPVATVMATDKDKTKDVSFSISSQKESLFSIDEDSGEIYLVGDFLCDNGCNFTVAAQDSTHQSELNACVKVLDLDHIYTIQFENSDVNEIGTTLASISERTGISLYLLYVNVKGVSGLTEQRASNMWLIEAQVYAVQGMTLLDLEDLNVILGDAGVTSLADPFSDQAYYQVAAPEKDFKTATIVLGCVLGLVLLVALAGSGYTIWRKKMNGRVESGRISTLGNAYSNHGFKDENEEPSFSTIFGNNPVEISPSYDTPEVTRSTNKEAQDTEKSSTSRDQTQTESAPESSTSTYYISSKYTPPRDNISKENTAESSSETYEIYNYDVKLHENIPNVDQITQKVDDDDVHVSSIYPVGELNKGYENQNIPDPSSIGDVKEASLIGNNSLTCPTSSSEKDDVSINSEKKSNIKLYPEIDYGGEEPKSVAFKVLVEEKIIENHNAEPEKQDKIEKDDAITVEESDDEHKFY